MNGPLIRPRGAQTVIRQVGTFADAHAGVAEQREDVSVQVVATKALLLQELILLCGKRPWQTPRRARDTFAPQEARELRKFACPSSSLKTARRATSRAMQVAVARGGKRARMRDIHPRACRSRRSCSRPMTFTIPA